MSAELDALRAAEAALVAAEAKLEAVEHPAGTVVLTVDSVYLGHIGEPAVAGKDF